MAPDERHEVLTQRMDRIEAAVQRLEGSIAENTKLTQDSKSDTADLLEVFRAVRGGFKVLGWLGNIAKWAAGIGGAIAGLYFTMRNGGPHP